MKFLGLEIEVLVIGSGQMHRSTTSDLVKQDSVGHIVRTDTDTKCAKDPAKEVGDKAASENGAARTQK
jgi:prephenate dehydrogenase